MQEALKTGTYDISRVVYCHSSILIQTTAPLFTVPYTYDISRVVVLPFVNLDPNNRTTIYSALHL